MQCEDFSTLVNYAPCGVCEMFVKCSQAGNSCLAWLDGLQGSQLKERLSCLARHILIVSLKAEILKRTTQGRV